MLSIGDTVMLPAGQTGILRWTGCIRGKAQEYAGVELTGEFAKDGKHSGEFGGRQYFRTEVPNSGQFLPYSKLVSANTSVPLAQISINRVPSADASGIASSRQSRSGLRTPGTPKLSRMSMSVASSNGSSGITPKVATRPQSGLSQSRQTPIGHVRQISSDQTEIDDLRQQLADQSSIIDDTRQRLSDKDARIAKLSHEKAQMHIDLRTTVRSLEEDRDRIINDYEQIIKQLQEARTDAIRSSSVLSSSPHSDGSGYRPKRDSLDSAELEVQKSALAAMENKLLQESVIMGEKLDAVRAERDAVQNELDDVRTENERLKEFSQREELDAVLAQLDQQEMLLQQAGQDKEELEALKRDFELLQQKNTELEVQASGYAKLKLELDDTRQELAGLSSRSAAESEYTSNASAKLELENDELRNKVKQLTAETHERSAKFEEEKKELKQRIALLETNLKEAETELKAPRRAAANAANFDTLEAERELLEEVEREEQLDRLRSSHNTPRPFGDELSPPAEPEAGFAAAVQTPTLADPAAGRKNWCGLCEKSGHSAEDCPFEDD